jgi:hypothetical protein
MFNVGCLNQVRKKDHTCVSDAKRYLAQTPLCDEKGAGFGLGRYTFLDLFGVATSFQCRCC